MNLKAFMPGDAVVAEITRGLGAYNEQRTAIHKMLKVRQPLVLGVFAILWLALTAYTFTWVMDGGSGWPVGIVFTLGFVAIFFVNDWVKGPATRLQQSFRDTFIPKAFGGFIDGVTYKQGKTPESFGHMPKAAVGHHNRQSFDDSISGTHKGFMFEVFEANLSQKSGKSTIQVFKGVIMAFRLDKPFSGTLVATKNVGSVTKFFRDLFGKGGLVQVESGNAEMDKLYEFRSDNADAARHLMGAGFLAALDHLRDAWPEAAGRVALSGGNAYMILPTTRNFFELPKISTACEYKQHIEPMVADITMLLSIAEDVKRAVDR